MFIKLHRPPNEGFSGDANAARPPVYVNADMIACCVRNEDDRTRLELFGTTLFCLETPEQIAELAGVKIAEVQP